jgi:hypothetical protein
MFQALKPRRWIVILGTGVGVVVSGFALHHHQPLYAALGEGLGTDLGVMIVCAVSARFWRGDDIDDASIAGNRIGFGAAEEPIDTVNKRVDAQVGELEERVFALEEEHDKTKVDDDSQGTGAGAPKRD